MSVRNVRRIAAEPAVKHVDDCRERAERKIGRPSKVAAFRTLVQELVEQVDEETHAPLKSVEILRRARLEGYQGGKSALIAELLAAWWRGCRRAAGSNTSPSSAYMMTPLRGAKLWWPRMRPLSLRPGDSPASATRSYVHAS